MTLQAKSGLRRLMTIAAPVVLLLSQIGASAAALRDLPFSSVSGWQATRIAAPLQKWRDVLDRADIENRRIRRCITDPACLDLAAQPLAALVLRLRHQPQARIIKAVNDHFNSFPYVPDRIAGVAVDRWLTPLAFDQISGDCEDYAIAKYFILRLLGISDRRMWLLLLREPARGIDHAVLMVSLDGRTLVLDNMRGLSPLAEYRHYRPLYAFNATGTWRLSGPDERFARFRGGRTGVGSIVKTVSATGVALP